MTDNEQTLIAHTDGACRGNPGPGGWGVLVQRGEAEQELLGAEAQTTNNRMEIMAAIEALKHTAQYEGTPLVIVTDSTYVKNGITDWIDNWKRRGWKTAAGKPVKNQDLWKELDAVSASRDVQWQWVKGHSGDPGNERADELANRAIDTML